MIRKPFVGHDAKDEVWIFAAHQMFQVVLHRINLFADCK
ncbi:hypothetical protein S1OALGB6SA_1754 [Olavius algarvensis spirochete endosymbiont]|nr:hypothetical protein S1OALGB6SA_1754 [Olavius algarvensis spirochete endosymbiont]